MTGPYTILSAARQTRVHIMWCTLNWTARGRWEGGSKGRMEGTKGGREEAMM